MNPKDFLIDAADGHLLASKNRAYQERVRLSFTTVIEYLQKRGLTARVILAPGQPVDMSTKIMASDLTEEGLALMHACYDKWLKSHDKGTPITDTSRLDKWLASRGKAPNSEKGGSDNDSAAQ